MHISPAQMWAQRAQAELGASRRFNELASKMESLGTHPRILDYVHKAEEDEDRHAFLCAKMALKFGHTSGFEHATTHRLSPVFSWHSLPERDRLLLDVILMGCITESINASLLNTLFTHSPSNEVGQLLHQILKDEVKHAQIGWAYLSEESQKRNCGFVAPYLVEMISFAVHDDLFLPLPQKGVDRLMSDQSSSIPSSYQYGVMPVKDRLSQFKETLYCVICPGFEQFNIDVSSLSVWFNQYSQ